MGYNLERCDVCKGAHPTKQHKMAQKMADHNFKADKQNWEQRAKRLKGAGKGDIPPKASTK